MTEQRYDKDGEQIEDAEPEKRESLSDMLNKKRAAALAKEEAAEQAKKLDALDERLNRPQVRRPRHRRHRQFFR